jgi:membrane-bound lytic murein transglycosylase D
MRHIAMALVALCLAGCATTPDREPWQRTAAPAAPAAPPALPASPGGAMAGEAAPTPAAPAPDAAALASAPTGAPAKPTPEAFPDLLDRMRAGFQLDDPDRTAIDTQLNWFARNPEYLERVFGRAELYMHHIVTEVERRGMPLELALLPVVESAFEPYAYSRSRASGLWQFIPGTGTRFGLPQNWWYDGRRDVLESTRAALDYLQFLHDEFNGDWLLAVAGYNCGEACVARAVRINTAAGRPIDFWSLRLPTETRAYAPKLLAMKRLIANPENYGIAFSPIANEPYFARVDLDSQIDLKVAAELAGIPHENLFELNPAFHRWATPPQGPFHLLLPSDTVDLFRQNLAQLTPDERMRVTHHQVRSGETLTAVARRYDSQPLTIRMLNDLGTGPLVAGTDLRVPSGATQLPPKVLRAAALFDAKGTRRGLRRPGFHVVRRGESLYAIARRNNMDTRTLMRLNNKQPGQVLRTGERLIVSRSAEAPVTARAASASGGGSSSGKARSLRHTVRSGDTLYRIARLYQVTVAQIVSWNGIAASTPLRPGQKLNINIRQGR